MSKPDIVWEDPPPKRRGGQVWKQRLAPLCERPGEWARVHVTENRQQADSISTRLRTGKIEVPGGPKSWEITSRGIDGKGAVYARYLGPASPEDVVDENDRR